MAIRTPAIRQPLVAGVALIVALSGPWAAAHASAAPPASEPVGTPEQQPKDALLRAMVESRQVRAKIPDVAETAHQVGGPLSPNFTGNSAKTTFRAAGVRQLRMPDAEHAPPHAAGALIQVTTHSKGAPVTVWADGSSTPLMKTPKAGVKSTSTVVRWDRPISVRTSAEADVYVLVHGWILDDPGAGVAAGGVGIAETRVARLETRKHHGPGWLTRSEGRVVQFTGRGGIPLKTAGVVVKAYLEPTSKATVSLELATGSQWRELTRLTSHRPVTQLLVLPVNADGTAQLRATGPIHARLTPLAWLSEGNSWSPPERTGAFVPIRPDAVNDGELGEGGAFDIPGVPNATGVIAVVSGQAFGNGRLQITTAGTDPHSLALPVRGPSTTLMLVPDAEDGAHISLTGSLKASVHVVGYIRVAQPAGGARRAASPITLQPDIADGAAVSIATTGVLTVHGQATSSSGIQDVSITMPGYPTFHADVDHIAGMFTAHLRPPAGTHTLTFTATNGEGATTTVQRTVTVETPRPFDDILNERAVTLTPQERTQITRVDKSRIVAIRPLRGEKGLPITAGNVILSAPFAASAEGLSRFVTAVSIRPQGVVYHTRPPKMNEIFEQASLGFDEQPGIQPRYEIDHSVGTRYAIPYEFKKDWGSGELTGSVQLNAEASGTLSIHVIIGSQWFFPELEYLQVIGTHLFKAEATANVNLDDQRDLYTATPFSASFMFGPIPVVIKVPLRVYLDLQGRVAVTAEAETELKWLVLYTREEQSGTTGWHEFKMSVFGPKWRIGGNYSADMRLGVEIEPQVSVAEALGVAGPIDFTLLGLKGTGELEADSNGKREYTCTEPLTLYSNTSMGLDFTLFGDSYRWPIIEKTQPRDIEWWRQSNCST